MQNGPYIAERLMPGVIRDVCSAHGIKHETYSDDWVIRLQKGSTTRWIVGYKFDVNRSAAGELAQDKVALYTALTAAEIPAVEHYLVRSLPHELIHVKDLHDKLAGRPVVAKPLEGTGGRNVTHFESIDEALTMIKGSGEPAWAVSPYYDFQAEYRLIMLRGGVLLAYNKTRPTYRGKLKLFNLSYDAVAADIDDARLLDELKALALRAMEATALDLTAVDIARDANGVLKVLEINDGISMEHYARQSLTYKNRAAAVYGTIVRSMFND